MSPQSNAGGPRHSLGHTKVAKPFGLILARFPGEQVVITSPVGEIVITVAKGGSQPRLAIKAPHCCQIKRGELTNG
jgi:sRNA-binding carbon storage regulator CsrA